jgi:ATP-dependent DNA helicase DinG
MLKKKDKTKKNDLKSWAQAINLPKDQFIIQYINEVIGVQGHIQAMVPNAEFRPSQVKMSEIVAELLANKHKAAIIEAPTGSGKSIAYAVPAILASQGSEKPVLVSTSTKNLQSQLTEKDLPLLQKLFKKYYGVDFEYTVCKGRSNYLCIRRFHKFLNLALPKRKKRRKKGEALDMFADDDAAQPKELSILEKAALVKANMKKVNKKKALDKLVHWFLNNPEEGDNREFGEVVNKGPMAEIWQHVCSNSDDCLNWQCSCASDCFFKKAKAKWSKVDLCIINHSLYFADAMIRQVSNSGILPDADHVIFDEADHVVDSAKNFQGIDVSSMWHVSIINQMRVHLGETGCLEEPLKTAAKKRAFLTLIKEVVDEINDFFSKIDRKYFKNPKDYIKRYKKFEISPKALVDALKRLEKELHDAYGFHNAKKNEDHAQSAMFFVNCVVNYKNNLLSVTERLDLDECCYFIEKYNRGGTYRIVIRGIPLDLSKFIQDATRGRRCVYTSATLASDQGLQYFGETIGVDVKRHDVAEAILPSPFDYQKNCLLYMPSMPSPKAGDEVHRATAKEVMNMAKIVPGGIFVLFTSYYAMQEVAAQIRDDLEDMGREVFVQGEGKVKDVIINEFRDAGNGVLFGVSSFWVGVDVQGAALSCVMIVKMPFARPNEPINEAIREFLERKGKSYFRDYDLPKATMFIRQGFGRLIRTSSDKGIIVILDARLNPQSMEKRCIKSVTPVPDSV